MRAISFLKARTLPRGLAPLYLAGNVEEPKSLTGLKPEALKNPPGVSEPCPWRLGALLGHAGSSATAYVVRLTELWTCFAFAWLVRV